MSAPYPGTGSLEEGGQDSDLAISLGQLDNRWVSAGVQHEHGHRLPVPMQGRQHRGQEVGGKHFKYVVEGFGQMGLKCWALTR